MERLHAYIGSVQSAFQQAPEVFHPVGMNVAIHIFNRVVDDGVIVLRIQAFVSLVISEFEQPRCSRASRPEPGIVSLKLEFWDVHFTELQCSFGQRDPVDPECPEVTSCILDKKGSAFECCPSLFSARKLACLASAIETCLGCLVVLFLSTVYASLFAQSTRWGQSS
jgi:hypothetical protein